MLPSLASVPRVDLSYLQDKLTLELVADEQGSLPPNDGVLTLSCAARRTIRMCSERCLQYVCQRRLDLPAYQVDGNVDIQIAIVDAARRFVFRSPLVSLCSHRKLLVEVVGSRNDAARKCGLLVVAQSGMTKVVAECLTKVNS